MSRAPACAAALLALALPAPAHAEALRTLREIGAMAPGQRSFTGSPLLPLAGIPSGPASIDPQPPGARGGGYEVLDIGDVSLVAGPWTYGTLSGDHVFGSLDAFLGAHQNEYDFVSLFVTEQLDFGAFYSPLQNSVTGIGAGFFDQTSDFGFGELEGFLFMNSIFGYTGSVRDALFFGQELGHRWGAYVRRSGGGRDMLGRDDAHWSFFLETQNSTMEGNAWTEVEPGIFETDHMAEVGYSALDMYLMGFRPKEEVPDWFLIEDPEILRNPLSWETAPESPPYYVVRAYVDEDEAPDLPAIRVRGTRRDVAVDDVIAVEGERRPDASESQREFRMAFVIMMPATEPLDFDGYLVVEDTRLQLAALWEEMVGGEARLFTDLGRSGTYALRPGTLPAAPAWERPEVDDEEDGAGCRASLGGVGGGAVALGLAAAGVLSRRPRRRPGPRRPLRPCPS